MLKSVLVAIALGLPEEETVVYLGLVAAWYMHLTGGDNETAWVDNKPVFDAVIKVNKADLSFKNKLFTILEEIEKICVN